MENDKENPNELADGNIQLVEKQSGGDHLSDNSRMKENEADDGADEKLVAEDGPLKSNKDASEVKFISVDSQNGDAKIVIENIKIAFSGMGKEELMKFANDPFWVRLRWFLFFLFWLLWVAMLAGAIAIIVVAPKCAAPAPLKWWEQSPLYQVLVPAYKDSGETPDGIGDLKGIQSELEYIEHLGIKGLAISSVFKLSVGGSDEATEDYYDVDPQFGTLEDFKKLVAAMKEKDLHLVLSLVPNHSSKKHSWFRKSEQNDPQYSDYYIWFYGPEKLDLEGNRLPPNNWKSVNGGSAWEWSSTRKAFYLHQFHKDEPDFNFRNPAVVKEFEGIFKYWLDLGVSGFQLEKVEYLLEDPRFQDEERLSPPGTIHDEYSFYQHTKTVNYPGIAEILADWYAVFKNYTDDTRMLSVVGNLSSDFLKQHQNGSSSPVVHLPQTNTLFSHLKVGFSAQELFLLIQKYLDRHPEGLRRTWQLGSTVSSRIATRLSPDYVDGLNMITMLLPGTPVTLYGEELGMEDATNKVEYPSRCCMSWTNGTYAGFTHALSSAYPTSKNYEYSNTAAEMQDSDSNLQVYKNLVAARNTPSIMYGAVEFTDVNSIVFAFTRIKSGNPGYLVAFNPADEEVTVSFTNLKHVPEELNVQIKSSNFNISDIKVKSKLNSDSVTLSPRGALVVTFVPKTD